MTTHDAYRFGLGPMHISVLTAISVGVHDIPSMMRHCNHKVAGPAFHAMIESMIRRGLIHRGRGALLCLTAKGRSELPAAPIAHMGVYVPAVAPPRRPGSDHSHIASRVGPNLYEYRPHC